MKYLFITLNVQDGENRHTHRVLHSTESKRLNFASQLYAKSYYGKGERNGDWWEFYSGSIAVKVESVLELSEYEYKLMSMIFSGDKERNNYFNIVQAGYLNTLEREEVEINCGQNGKLMIVKTDEGFVIDVYNQMAHVDTMTVWEDDLTPEELTIDPKIHEEQINEFLKTLGQKHSTITANLGLRRSHTDSDEILMEDYFYLEGRKEWYPKNSTMFSDMERAIADYLRDNRDNY